MFTDVQTLQFKSQQKWQTIEESVDSDHISACKIVSDLLDSKILKVSENLNFEHKACICNKLCTRNIFVRLLRNNGITLVGAKIDVKQFIFRSSFHVLNKRITKTSKAFVKV